MHGQNTYSSVKVCFIPAIIPTGCGHSEFIGPGDQVYLVIIYIVLGIVLIGLILILLFRLYTWRLDRIEYQQFLEERCKTEWDDVS